MILLHNYGYVHFVGLWWPDEKRIVGKQISQWVRSFIQHRYMYKVVFHKLTNIYLSYSGRV